MMQVTTLCAWENGHVDLLMWAVDSGCPWYQHMKVDAQELQLEGGAVFLKWAVDRHCPWIADLETTCAIAGDGC